MNDLFVNRIWLNDEGLPVGRYPFNIPCIRNFKYKIFHSPVTFFYGKNGIGKSTFLEAIAMNLMLNPEGGDIDMDYSTYDDYSELYKWLRVSKSPNKPVHKFFLRAESFYNVATAVDTGEVNAMHYGGTLHDKSHGESFLQLIKTFKGDSVYVLDEPEAALSPENQILLLEYIDLLIKQGSQFIIATHSPILLAYKNSVILDLNNNLEEIDYEDTNVYKIYKDFLDNPIKKQQEIFKEDEAEIVRQEQEKNRDSLKFALIEKYDLGKASAEQIMSILRTNEDVEKYKTWLRKERIDRDVHYAYFLSQAVKIYEEGRK